MKPSCTACRSAEKPCVYEATTKKRGLPEGYVRSLEKLLAIATQSIDGLEDALVACMQDEVVRKSWNSAVAEEVHSSHWKDSHLHQELESLLGNIQNNNSAGTKRKRNSEADTPEDASSMLQSLKAVSYCVVRGHHEESNRLLSAPKAQTLDHEPFPRDSHRLFDLYFTHVHCWFPILTRPSILKSYYECSRRAPSTRTSESESADRALLWAILAYAVMIDVDGAEARHEMSQRFQAISLQHLLSHAKLNETKGESEQCIASSNQEQNQNVRKSDFEQRDISARSQNSVSGNIEGFTVVHAQALLILALLEQGRNRWLRSWMMISSAKRVLLAHDKQGNRSFIKSALRGCFVIEMFLNMHWHFDHEPFTQPELMDEDGHEEWEPWSTPVGYSNGSPSFASSVFNRLSQVLQAIVNSSSSVHERLQEAFRLQKANANAGVPPVSQGSSPPHHVYLQLGFTFAQLALSSDSGMRRNAAAHIFDLLETCKSPHIGLGRVPPLFSDVLHTANNELLSHQGLVTKYVTLRAELAQYWPVFEAQDGTSTICKSTIANASVGPDAVNRPSVAGNLIRFPSTGNLLEDTMPLQNQWVQTPTAPPSAGTPQLDTTQSPFYAQVSGTRSDSFNQINSWARYQRVSQRADQSNSASYPVTSPSFQGDEIDAIFHEMAHLDTNEWTTERALGLKEFGFNDDSAFVEFCNDPERLAIPAETGNLPLSSSRQSWTFAAQPL